MNQDEEHLLLTERERGGRAQQLMENPIWDEAWTVAADSLRGHMEDVQSTDEVVLEARRGLVILKRVRAYVEEVAVTGKMAEQQLTERSVHGRTTTSKH